MVLSESPWTANRRETVRSCQTWSIKLVQTCNVLLVKRQPAYSDKRSLSFLLGFEVSTTGMGGSWHPLHSALIFGELEKAKTLVSKSETEQAELLNHANDKGWRAIHFASHSGSIASVS